MILSGSQVLITMTLLGGHITVDAHRSTRFGQTCRTMNYRIYLIDLCSVSDSSVTEILSQISMCIRVQV